MSGSQWGGSFIILELSNSGSPPAEPGDYLYVFYLTCYHVLRANQDARAEVVLREAHDLLQESAAKIGDEEMRRSFLENVAAHHEIVLAWKEQEAQDAQLVA